MTSAEWAAWVQAIGSLLAIAAVVIVSRVEGAERRRQDLADRRIRAQALALLFNPEMAQFVQRLRHVHKNAVVKDAAVGVPPTLVARIGDLHQMGTAGGALLSMVGALNANKPMVEVSLEGIADHGLADEDVWPYVAPNIAAAIDFLDEALAEMKKIIDDGKR